MKKIPSMPDLNSPEFLARVKESKTNKYNHLRPFMMDYWYEDLKDLTFPAEFVEIPKDTFVKLWDGASIETLSDFINELDTILNGQKHFVKTSNRSSKDLTYPDAPSASNGHEAAEVLAGSMRVFEDVCDVCDIDGSIYAIIRPWIEIPKDKEFRCFVKDNDLIGISQYFYDQEFDYNENELRIYENAIKDIFVKIVERYDQDTYVFDVYIEDNKAVLIEINPYGLSDPCLFEDYEALESMGGFKVK